MGADLANEVWSMYGEGYVPHNILIGQNMKVLYSHSGYDLSTITNLIETDLNKPPLPPSNLEVNESLPISIGLSWQASIHTDVAGYKILYDKVNKDTKTFSEIDVGNVTEATVTNLELFTSYQFKVVAYDYRNNESNASNTVVGTTQGVVPTLSQVGFLIILLLFSVLILISRFYSASILNVKGN